ncbi:hypothetical protein BST81_20215 [Leptolyngbya sp. 'hensonii']|nr:hypothetical protein BST81_20215 [Leptolyngbya sp. 'hensonii']
MWLAVGLGITQPASISPSGNALLTAPTPPLPVQVAAASSQCEAFYKVVKTRDRNGVLNLRTKPGNNTDVIGTVSNGSEVIANIYDRSGNWAEITIKGGKTGWVASAFLAPHPSESRRFKGTKQVRTLDGDPVNIRSQGVNSKIIGTVASGMIVNIVQTIGYDSEITAPNGLRGYIDNRFLICN